MKRLTLILSVACLLGLLGCGTGRGNLGSSAAAPEANALPALAELDQLPQPVTQRPRPASSRQASFVDQEIWATTPLVTSTNAKPFQSWYRLLASGGKLEYAVQRTDVGGLRLSKLTVNIELETGSVYCAFANFKTGVWEIKPAAELKDPTLEGDNLEDYLSPEGYYYFAVLAYGGTDMQWYGFHTSAEVGDPVVTDVTALSNNATDTRLVDCHGKPVIVFRDSGDDKIKAAWAKSDKPAGPADWDVYDITEADPGYRPFDAIMHKGKLHVCYGAAGLSQLRLSVLDGDPAEGTAAWSKHVIDNGQGEVGQWRYYASMISLNSKLHLVYLVWDNLDLDSDGNHGVLYYTELDDTYSGPRYILQKIANNSAPEPSLAAINGRPAVAWSDETALGLYYAGAWNADPKSGEWDIVPTEAEGADAQEVKLLEINGCPEILHLKDGTLEFCVVRSLVEHPTDINDWAYYQWGINVTQGEFGATMTHGYPCLIWPNYEAPGRRVYLFRTYRRELNPGDYPWPSYRAVDETQATFGSMHMTTLNGEPAASYIHYSGGEPDMLKFLRLDFPE